MPASPQVDAQADADPLIEKVEQAVVHRANLNNQGLMLHFRVVLQDLPFAGQPALLLDEHRQAIARLVDRAARDDVKIFSVTGHTSEPGTLQYNEGLALQRAQAVFDHLRHTVDQDARFTDNSLYAQIEVRGRGETQPVVAMADEGDNPLNRRVEIAYRIKITFPQPPGGQVPRSRFWKVDFTTGGGAGVGGGSDANRHRAIGAELGTGTLTMLPDDETGQTQEIMRPLTFESLGISVGLLSLVKKLKFVKRFPTVKRLLDFLEGADDAPSAYPVTEELLRNAGFAVDLASEGGGFFVDEPLSFEEMARFNFAQITGELSWLGSATGSLILLHSPNFFASTILYGAGLKLALPDASVEFVPIAWVQVQV